MNASVFLFSFEKSRRTQFEFFILVESFVSARPKFVFHKPDSTFEKSLKYQFGFQTAWRISNKSNRNTKCFKL